jgi:putative transcriptional regulator
MDKHAFDDLLKSARDMGRHMRGQRVAGVRETSIEEPEASAVREAVKMSQREFALLVGVPVKTLQNWEQKRTRPTGPARALLRAIAKDPEHVLRALAA